MNGLRLLIVSPRYWPLVGDQERAHANLVEQLCRRGVATTVLTAKWHASWPDLVLHRQAWVVRLSHAPRGGWATFRYLRELTRWISEHRPDFDVVYVMNLRQEAYAVLSALPPPGPAVVLQAQRAGWTGDCAWQERARFGKRVRKHCREAAAIVATCEASAQELRSAGYSQVTLIPSGAAEAPPRSASDRFRARAALAEVNCDLFVAEYTPVAVCVEQFDERRGLADLIRAWVPIAARWPATRLWLIGDGPLREALYEQIVDLGLQHHIQMPGSFDDLRELLLAGDVYVSASPDFGFTPTLAEAMAAGLPVVACDSPDVRELIEPRVQGILVPPGDVRSLTQALALLFESAQLAAQLGLAAWRRVRERFPLSRTVEQHLELFQRLRQLASAAPEP